MNILYHNDFATHNPDCDSKVYIVKASNNIHFKYQELSIFLLERDNYEFFDLEEYTPYDVIQKYNYIKNIQLNIPVIIQ